jgi:two-component system phosphate regulon response regulator OmpR
MMARRLFDALARPFSSRLAVLPARRVERRVAVQPGLSTGGLGCYNRRMNDSPHVLVVDDDRRLRELLRRYLADNGFRVTTAEHAEDARAKLGSLAFDLLVLDVMMPGEDGFQFAQALRKESPVPILFLTARGEAEDRIIGFERGADDYLAKPFEPRELVLRITSILRRARAPEAAPSAAAPVRLGDFAFELTRGVLARGSVPVRLTSAETSLLAMLAQNAGTTFSREEILRRSGINGNARSIDVLVTRLRRKIEPDPRMPRYLQTVRGSGYVLRPD